MTMVSGRRRSPEKQAEMDRQEAERREADRQAAPRRILELMTQATTLRVDHRLSVVKANPVVKFFLGDRRGDDDYTHLITLDSESWEIDSVQRDFDDLVAKRQEAARKLQAKQDAWDSLTQEQREALGLLQRPIF